MEAYRNKFIKEARTIARLQHNNVISIHDVFEENNTAYYVMEYIEGDTLAGLVKRLRVLRRKGRQLTYRGVFFEYLAHREVAHFNVV